MEQRAYSDLYVDEQPEQDLLPKAEAVTKRDPLNTLPRYIAELFADLDAGEEVTADFLPKRASPEQFRELEEAIAESESAIANGTAKIYDTPEELFAEWTREDAEV